MRRNTVPPRPRADEARLRAPERTPEPKRKIFNCIVDDTALIAGAKKSTRDGIRKWVSQDAIRLFVPLHTLTQLNRLKTGSERFNIDAREALKWLDDITSLPAIDDRVQLEGVDEAYTTWGEVEEFLLPETLLSMEESDSDEDYHEDLESSFNALDVSDETSMSSTHSLEQSPRSPRSAKPQFSAANELTEDDDAYERTAHTSFSESLDRTARNSSDLSCAEKSPKNGIPNHLHPLFNHILWRIHKESNPDAALESFILLTNDPAKQVIAQKFGIRAKRLEQLRDAVAREDREYKNHLVIFKKESEGRITNENTIPPRPAERPKSSHSNISKPAADSDDEDEVLLKLAPRGPANPTINQRVFDPNDFARPNSHLSPRGGRGRGGFGAPRGRGVRGGPPRGRGAFVPRGAYVPPGPSFRPPPAPRHDPNQPIDPDSFARPSPRGSGIRGNGRTLWDPN
ncbi:hypothetical protein K458DRAFT_398278 [Lentithecium fluviatile CBS 122367]|uniref:PIN domain-containing protein n=1 Tax=Lentithecium fluviatile CBS 122367 TaxID=1168545 RepID=A0A6G1JP09_9PLEO|nr:hypothetical protein K458DRAFT_398278 [Lentithecium fluviatile CBS 122367]